jgi:phosphopentomutase
MDAIDNDTTLILWSDHGTKLTFGHGLKSKEEIETVLFGYNKKGFIKHKDIS